MGDILSLKTRVKQALDVWLGLMPNENISIFSSASDHILEDSLNIQLLNLEAVLHDSLTFAWQQPNAQPQLTYSSLSRIVTLSTFLHALCSVWDEDPLGLKMLKTNQISSLGGALWCLQNNKIDLSNAGAELDGGPWVAKDLVATPAASLPLFFPLMQMVATVILSSGIFKMS